MDHSDAPVSVRDVADDAVLMSVDLPPGELASAWVVGVDEALRRLQPPWLLHAQPAYTSLQVVFRADVDAEQVKQALLALRPVSFETFARHHVVDVVYDGADLDDVAATCGLSVDDVIDAHSRPTYRVAFIGFVPGFPYLLGLDARLAVPRLERPRPRVPAGSVAIAGAQAGIYPSASPGGWRLLATSVGPVPTFQAGDTVTFRRQPVAEAAP